MNGSRESAGRPAAEIAAIVATGGLHFLFETVLDAKAAFIAIASLGWLVYVALSVRRDRAVARDWGFRLDNLRAAWPGPAAILLAGAGLLAIAGVARFGALAANVHLPILLAVYPLWGLVQQFLLQAMLARNLRAFLASPLAVTIAAAALFGAVHLPDAVLAGATFLLALCFTPLYLRHRNLLTLGVVHGWLGALAYFWVLGRDPWQELFG